MISFASLVEKDIANEVIMYIAIRQYSRFLFVLVMFCKVTANIESANTEPLLLGEIQG